jgi:hypothetical protein
VTNIRHTRTVPPWSRLLQPRLPPIIFRTPKAEVAENMECVNVVKVLPECSNWQIACPMVPISCVYPAPEPNRESQSTAQKLRHSRSLKISRTVHLMRHAHKRKTAVSSVKSGGPFSSSAAPLSARSFSRSTRRMPERRVVQKSMESSTQVTALLQKSYKKGTRRHKKSVHRNIVSPSPSSSGRERMADLRYARGMKVRACIRKGTTTCSSV